MFEKLEEYELDELLNVIINILGKYVKSESIRIDTVYHTICIDTDDIISYRLFFKYDMRYFGYSKTILDKNNSDLQNVITIHTEQYDTQHKYLEDIKSHLNRIFDNV